MLLSIVGSSGQHSERRASEPAALPQLS